MIQAGNIVSFIHIGGETRRTGTGFVHEDIEEKRRHKILKAIHEGKNFDYYDKYGNKYDISEIWYCNNCKAETACSNIVLEYLVKTKKDMNIVSYFKR